MLAPQSAPSLLLADFQNSECREALNAVGAAQAVIQPSGLIVFGVPDVKADILTCVQAGIPWVSSDVSLKRFEESVDLILEGHLPCSPFASRVLFDHCLPPRSAPRTNFMDASCPFTRREQDVASLLSQGLTNKEIARSLNISTSTVKVHVSNILHKLNASTRTQAASVYQRGTATV